jgi:hypothetical protein
MSRNNGVSPLPQSACGGLQLLAAAHLYSRTLHADPWDFAVRFQELRAAGCTTNDLRYLVLRGFVENAVEIVRNHKHEFRKRQKVSVSPRSFYVLTDRGFEFASKCGLGSNGLADKGQPTALTLKPQFVHRELRVGGKIVKKFRQPAESQETILLAFEELGWSQEIDDPLPKAPNLDPKQRLRQTIANLNRHQLQPLIHFFGNGTGQKIGWEWRT